MPGSGIFFERDPAGIQFDAGVLSLPLPQTHQIHQTPPPPRAQVHRSLQLALFAASITWVVAANVLATRAARGLVVRFQISDGFLFLNAIFLIFLVAFGFIVLQGVAARNTPTRKTLGLSRHPTARTEWASGAAIGWGIVLVAVMPMAIAGTLHIRFWTEGRSLWLGILNVATIGLLALAAEISFRGYAFQRLIDAVGPGWATIVMSFIYGLASTFNQDSTYLSSFIAVLFGLVLCIAWLRTHALWLSWGLHFAWIVSLGILFGLPVMGIDNLSSVVQTRAIGPIWLTGGDLGPEGALLTPLLLLAAIPVLVKMTSNWAWDYTRRPLIPAGYAMDVPPPAAHTEMERQAAASALVQIIPTTPQTRSVESQDHVQPSKFGPPQ